MATLYGVNSQLLQNVPSEKVDVSSFHGRVRWVYDEYDAPGAIALNDEIVLGRLPKGAKIVEAILAFDDLGTVGELDLGYKYDDADLTSDPNAFLDDVDVNAAAGTVKMSDQANMVGFGIEMEGEADVVATAVAATDAAGKIRCAIAYVLD